MGSGSEILIAGRLGHPTLASPDHAKCGLACTFFNKSKRKAYIHEVKAFDRHNQPIDITWANRINECGNPEDPCHLIGVIDSETLYLRGNSGREIEFCRLEIYHSFSSQPVTVVFDTFKEFEQT